MIFRILAEIHFVKDNSITNSGGGTNGKKANHCSDVWNYHD